MLHATLPRPLFVIFTPQMQISYYTINTKIGGVGGGGTDHQKFKSRYWLALLDAPVPDDGGDDNDDDSGGGGGGSGGGTTASSGGNGRRKVTRKMALVHWWYYPSSYDEWLPASEVPAAVDGEENHGIVPRGGPCVVGCMNPRGILTGLRGQRGGIVRRTVHNGALHMENGAHAVVRDTLADFLLGSATAAAAAGIGGGRSTATASTVTLLTIFSMGVTKGQGCEALGARLRPPRGEWRARRREGHARLLGSATAVAAAGIGGGRSAVTESTATLSTILLMVAPKGARW